jgi:hypothetical protein
VLEAGEPEDTQIMLWEEGQELQREKLLLLTKLMEVHKQREVQVVEEMEHCLGEQQVYPVVVEEEDTTVVVVDREVWDGHGVVLVGQVL